ncbi:MAG: hypothetical protein CMP59_12785 [Flavobacteriales bacterium]|nr:hypothetical protein [Flavobacteriales bacterium]|tara:strand:- start:160 stop:2133 length:1974 start_codon:yes stop_codon:yes gene_type:complete
MKKNYALLTGLILMSSVGFSQSLIGNAQAEEGTPRLTQGVKAPLAKKTPQKAFRDTILYEDFAGALPAGWTVSNNASNGNDWVWAAGATAPGGQYSTNTAALSSTSSANGYMMLPADFYNTPFPPGGPIGMDTWFSSPSFSMNPVVNSVIIKFEHSQRYCCNAANDLVLEVSSDNINWTTFDATGGRSPNTATPNGEELTINVSAVLANQTTGYLRFRSTGNSHYYWMIDDILVYQGPGNSFELENFDIAFNPTFDIRPIYTIIPQSNMPPATYTGFTWNYGGFDQTNSTFNVDAIMDSAIGGGAGTGLAYSASTGFGTVLSLERDTVSVTAPFFTFAPGWYRQRMYITSDSVSQLPAIAEDNYTLAITLDSTIALDNGEAAFASNATAGPPGYVGGGNDGDRIGVLMIIDSTLNPNGVMATSVSYWMPRVRQTELHGLQISPRVWPFHEDSASLQNAVRPAVAQSPFSITLDTCNATCPGTSTVGQWITVPFFPPTMLTPGAYLFGLEQTGGAANGKELWAGRDVAQESIAPVFSNIQFINEAGNGRWISNLVITGIRFNGQFAVGIEDQAEEAKVDFNVYPNPNNGLFTMKVSSNVATTYTMNVRNMVGQTVMSEAINVNGNTVKQMDLTSFDKGVYFVTLENGEDRLVRKVVVK